MSNLSQINIKFNPVEDRLLLQLKTQALAEFRFWMTRRFVKALWPALVNCLASNETVLGQSENDARKTVLSFQHENAIAQSNFQTAYHEEVRETPLGTEPIVLARANITRMSPTQAKLGLYPAQGRGIELVLDESMLHSVCRLLSTTVAKASWGMELKVGEQQPEPSASTARRFN